MYYRKGTFRDVLGCFEKRAGSEVGPGICVVYCVFRGELRNALSSFETDPIGRSGTSPHPGHGELGRAQQIAQPPGMGDMRHVTPPPPGSSTVPRLLFATPPGSPRW